MPLTQPRSHLIVFLRAPLPGSVKTRLADTLGPVVALRIYQTLLDQLVALLTSAIDFQIELRFTPDHALPDVRPYLRPSWIATPQGPGNLGDRLARATREAFDSGAPRVLLIGSDCPYLTAAHLTEANQALDSADLVLGPATDGGYWLLGLTRPQPALFENIPWSTPAVLTTTLTIARELHLQVATLQPLEDIDTPDAWERFRRSGQVQRSAFDVQQSP